MRDCKKCTNPTPEESGLCHSCQATIEKDKAGEEYAEYKETCSECGNSKFKGMSCHHCERIRSENQPKALAVTVTDITMPFWSMVIFMVKLALASIPAIIILMFIFSLIGGVLTGILSSV
jgi:hypothetical protein